MTVWNIRMRTRDKLFSRRLAPVVWAVRPGEGSYLCWLRVAELQHDIVSIFTQFSVRFGNIRCENGHTARLRVQCRSSSHQTGTKRERKWKRSNWSKLFRIPTIKYFVSPLGQSILRHCPYLFYRLRFQMELRRIAWIGMYHNTIYTRIRHLIF